MDMNNATAAGPSYGLLDILIGTKPKEGEEADGFSPLMKMIEAMKKENAIEDASRTDKETTSGKDTIDYRVAGTPDLFEGKEAGKGLEAEQDAMARLAALYAFRNSSPNPLELRAIPQEQALTPAAGKPGSIDLEQVNRLLKERSLPPLQGEELKLFQAVNEKLPLVADRLQNSEQKAAPALPPASDLLKAELAQRGLAEASVGKVSTDTMAQSAAPEKFLNTETYLQMHESMGQKAGKTPLKEATELDRMSAPLVDGKPAASALERVVAKDSKDSLGDLERKPTEVRPEKAESKLKDSSPFAVLPEHKPEVSSKDVVLSSVKPEEVRNTLLGELQEGVNLQTVKGGGEMKLIIYPEQLGEVTIKVGTKEGKVDVKVTAENEDVAKIIRSGSKELESSLRDQSLSLTRFEVTVSESSVSSLDNKTSLSEQFLPQNSQNGFQQSGNQNEGRFARWDGGQDQRQGGAFEAKAEDQGRSEKQGRFIPKQTARDSSRRLDVVA